MDFVVGKRGLKTDSIVFDAIGLEFWNYVSVKSASRDGDFLFGQSANDFLGHKSTALLRSDDFQGSFDRWEVLVVDVSAGREISVFCAPPAFSASRCLASS